MTTSIEWTKPPGFRGDTWNPVIGCRRVSPGCENCYAETMAARIVRMGQAAADRYRMVVKHDGDGKPRARWNGTFLEVPEMLAAPLRTKAPTCWFVNSMSDLFGEGVSDQYIAAVFGVMAACPQHRFQILTKRAERMAAWFQWAREADAVGEGINAAVTEMFGVPVLNEYLLRNQGKREEAGDDGDYDHLITDPPDWPLPNVWMGVSVEDQQRADERIPHLLRVPAAVRFLSVEPLLGPVDLEPWLYVPTRCRACGHGAAYYDTNPQGLPEKYGKCAMGAPMTGEPGAARCAKCHSLDVEELSPLQWVIVGGESGHDARIFDPAWARALRDQCTAAEVPMFLKQLGARPIFHKGPGTPVSEGLRDRKGGDESEWPEDLRGLRQWPEVRA